MPSLLGARIARRVEALPKGLREHIYRAQEMAAELARLHHLDEKRALLGTLAHDIARAMKGDQLLTTARELGLPVHPVEERVPVLLHGPVGAELLRQVDGLEDQEIYQAVYWHTTAHADLPEIAKLVFLADKLDPQKAGRYPYLDQIRELAMHSLDRAMLEFLTREMASLDEAGSLVHPTSVEVRNALLLKSNA